MLGASVLVRGVTYPCCFQGRFISRPGRIDAFVYPGKMDQQRRFDLGSVFCCRVVAIERHCSRQVRQTHSQRMCHTPTVAETDNPQFACRVRVRLQPLGRSHKVFCCLLLVQGRKQGPGFVFIAGIASQGRQGIRRKDQIALQGEATGDVFNVWIQAPVFMHHQNGRQLALRACGTYQVPFGSSIACG